MIELDLLGLSDGQKLSLNDSEGNRYVLPITDELRAALRTDVQRDDDSEPRPITPREIQAHFRSGLTVAEVSEISSLPPSQLTGLASPIFAEREYTSQLARAYRLGHDVGGMTLEELVISRLISRDIDPSSVTWDAYRDQGEPWMLVARYSSGGREYTALWKVNTKAQTVQAHNDEATWLTENQIPAPTSPWRKPNTPAISASSEQTPSEKISAIDAEPASSGTPVDIDTMLASLNSKRGASQPMPTEADFDGAHPAHSEPEAAVDATVLKLPDREAAKPVEDNASEESEGSDVLPGQQELPGVTAAAEEKSREAGNSGKAKKKRRRERPAMPSWDEIVFGYSKDS